MPNWTAIPDSDVDYDSIVDENLMTDLKKNIEHNMERAMRCGSYASPVRLAHARGYKDVSATTGGGGATGLQTVTVTFSTDSIDGDPNFLTATVPTVTFGIQERGGGSFTALPTGVSIPVWIDYGSTFDNTQFTIQWEINGAAGTTLYGIRIHWMAVGNVSSGE